MDVPRLLSIQRRPWEDLISVTWVGFFCLHIVVVGMYRFTLFDGRYLLTPNELTSACFQVMNTFLAPFFSIVVFYVLENKIAGVKTSTKLAIMTLALTWISNLLFTGYILSPIFSPVTEGDTLVQRYGEASMLVGMANVAILGPLSALVFSGENN